MKIAFKVFVIYNIVATAKKSLELITLFYNEMKCNVIVDMTK